MFLTFKWTDIFSRLNTIKLFVTYFSSLILHPVNVLLWKKILSLTLFKVITVSIPSTLIRIFFMERSGCPTKGRNWVEDFRASPKMWTFPFCWISPPLKNWDPCPSPDHRPHIEKKVSLIAFRQVLAKLWKDMMELSPLIQNSIQQDYLPELYLRHLPSYQKCHLLWCCFVASTMCGLSLFPWIFMGKTGDGKESYPTTKAFFISTSRKVSLNRFTCCTIKSVIPSLSKRNFNVNTLCKLYL